MILSQLGKLCDAESLAASDGYIGYCLDMQRATGYIGNAPDVWIVISTNVAADYTSENETYELQLRCGTGTDGTDINAGAKIVLSTGAMNSNDERLATAGKHVLRCSLPYEANLRYIQFYYLQTGTTPTWTIDASISPTKPPTDDNIQVTSSNVGVP
jgi:hypothetical protein